MSTRSGPNRRARLLGQFGSPLQIGDHHSIAVPDNGLKGRRDRHTDEIATTSNLRVDHRRDLHAGIERADHRDLRQIGNAGKRHTGKARSAAVANTMPHSALARRKKPKDTDRYSTVRRDFSAKPCGVR